MHTFYLDFPYRSGYATTVDLYLGYLRAETIKNDYDFS
jgi:hypothetical protein